MSYWDSADVSGDLRGRPLRYLLVAILDGAGGPCSVAELEAACEGRDVVFAGRPSKAISDALRWEIRAGRVKRLRRGVYSIHKLPKSTRTWIRQRNAQTMLRLNWCADQRKLLSNSGSALCSGPEVSPGPDALPGWHTKSWVPPWPRWYTPEPETPSGS